MTHRCGLRVSLGRHLQPGSWFYLLMGSGRQIGKPVPAAVNTGWHGIRHERTWAETPTDRVPGIVSCSAFLVGDQRARHVPAAQGAA